MKIKIGILNSKGGCGKTTIAINLSVAISHQMIKTVLIDADPNQGALFWFKKRNKNHLSYYLKVASLNKLSRIRKGKTDLVFVINRYKKRAQIFKKLNTFLLSKKIKPLCRLSDRIAYQLLASEGKSIFDVNHKPIYNLKNEWVPLLHFLKVK